jgi:hypothetical protein
MPKKSKAETGKTTYKLTPQEKADTILYLADILSNGQDDVQVAAHETLLALARYRINRRAVSTKGGVR